MNDLDLRLEVVSRSLSTIALHSKLNISKTVRERLGRKRATNRKWHMGYQMVTRDRWRHVTQRCCEAVRSAILATAWLHVTVRAGYSEGNIRCIINPWQSQRFTIVHMCFKNCLQRGDTNTHKQWFWYHSSIASTANCFRRLPNLDNSRHCLHHLVPPKTSVYCP